MLNIDEQIKNFLEAIEIISANHSTQLFINKPYDSYVGELGKTEYSIRIKDCCASVMNDLIDAGLYLNYGPLDTVDREQRMDMEIIGSFDYTDFAQSEIYVNDDNKVSGMANGKFWNPYRDEEQLGLLIFENIEIGTDPDATFYTGE